MVNYKVRTFYEKDTGTAGADIIIYSDTGDVIDTLLVTTESTYNNLVEQIESIDQKYVDRNELISIIKNTSGEILEINATLLNGHNADYFAKNDHNHDTIYAPRSHVDILSSDSSLGHVKTINNLSRNVNVNGEALSAYQGKLLDDKINSAISSRKTWTKLSVGTYGTIWYNSALRLVEFRYNHSRDSALNTTGDIASTYAKIPKAYCPVTGTVIPCLNPRLSMYVSSDGDLSYATNGTVKTLNATGMWHY